jgi:hypothetical protein
MRPGHTPETGVVCTHDQFESEGDPIPEGEFALLIPRQQAPPAGRPGQAHDGRRILGTGHVGEVGYVTRRRIGSRDSRQWHAHQSQIRRMGLKVRVVVLDVR